MREGDINTHNGEDGPKEETLCDTRSPQLQASTQKWNIMYLGISSFAYSLISKIDRERTSLVCNRGVSNHVLQLYQGGATGGLAIATGGSRDCYRDFEKEKKGHKGLNQFPNYHIHPKLLDKK